ncbi:hypothetical protein MJO28_012017 [Puccinia striiformis f. sp. tritici]|uniref:Uncharacterized protein n=1 Tax=Puccinia striiformis f. sp. tritici TaxID=168172 RepID=A0ACC0E0U8_9BASI|nr:hypothetical protein MJO28_012017 [Puccinia striiformis f. sp. tritici]KAI7946090.1 hypothetical protein MJO29_012478 [Puccinia striiformis f. sp. tritici]
MIALWVDEVNAVPGWKGAKKKKCQDRQTVDGRREARRIYGLRAMGEEKSADLPERRCGPRGREVDCGCGWEKRSRWEARREESTCLYIHNS